MAMMTIRGKELLPMVTCQGLQNATLNCGRQEDTHSAGVTSAVARITVSPCFAVKLCNRGAKPTHTEGTSLVAARF